MGINRSVVECPQCGFERAIRSAECKRASYGERLTCPACGYRNGKQGYGVFGLADSGGWDRCVAFGKTPTPEQIEVLKTEALTNRKLNPARCYLTVFTPEHGVQWLLGNESLVIHP